MDDFVLMEIDEGAYYLRQVILDLDFCESLPALDELIESLVGAHLQQDVDILVILEHMLELHDVLVA